jgi:hypothetical protein
VRLPTTTEIEAAAIGVLIVAACMISIIPYV